MESIRDLVDSGRRAAADVLSAGGIERDAPWSPEVPEDLRSWCPDLFDRFPIVLPWSQPEPVDPAKHHVWILDNTAFPAPGLGDRRSALQAASDPKKTQPESIDASGRRQEVDTSPVWDVEFVAAYFINNSGKDISRIVARIAEILDISPDDSATRKRIATRLQPFLDTVLPKRTMRIQIADREEQTLGPSNMSGVSTDLLQLHFETSESQIKSSAINLPPPFTIPAVTVLAEERGWGIISDVDDTIKVTKTPSPVEVLRATFIKETPEVVPGMPELYADMHSVFKSPAWFYLSASPYNLYPFLRQFRNDHFPQGTMILRDASWQNLGGLITSLSRGTQAYKVDRIEKINSWFPRRKFLLIGDSTQSDPEAYGEIAKKHSGWVKAIFIRKVTGIDEMDATKNEDARFDKAFEGLDRGLWKVFTEPAELRSMVNDLAASS